MTRSYIRNQKKLPGSSAGVPACSTWNTRTICKPPLCPVLNDPAHDRRDYFPRELPAIERRIARFGKRLRCVERPTFFGIKNSHIGVAAASKRAAASQIDHARRPRGEQLHDSRQRNFLF